MWPEATTFIQNGFVVQIYKNEIPHYCLSVFISTLEFQISQVSHISNTEVIKYMCKSLNSMQISAHENVASR